MVVIARSTDKKSVKEFGSPEDFLKELSYLFGEQTFTGVYRSSHDMQLLLFQACRPSCLYHFCCYAGQTRSEGGFKPNKTSSASLLGIKQSEDKNGKAQYKYELLIRSGE